MPFFLASLSRSALHDWNALAPRQTNGGTSSTIVSSGPDTCVEAAPAASPLLKLLMNFVIGAINSAFVGWALAGGARVNTRAAAMVRVRMNIPLPGLGTGDDGAWN